RCARGAAPVGVPGRGTEGWGPSGRGGPRTATMWGRAKGRTAPPEPAGSVRPEDSAPPPNVLPNRLYGVHLGVGNEWFLGDTPVGAFSVSLDVQAALFFDFAKGRPKYELGDRSTAASHPRNFRAFVPEVEAQLNFWWYPYEG